MVVGTRLRPPTAVRRRAYTTAARGPILAAALVVPRYDPLFDIEGAFFPSWMLCAVIGIATAFAGRWLFVRAGLDPYLGPRRMVYPSLALLVALVLWVALFRS